MSKEEQPSEKESLSNSHLGTLAHVAEDSIKPSLYTLVLQVTLTIGSLLLALCAIWYLVGSFWFPVWWYDAVFRGDLFNGAYVMYGVHYLENQRPGFLVILALAIALVSSYAWWKQAYIIRVFKPIRLLIVAVSFGLILMVSAFLNYTEHGKRYQPMEDFQHSLAYSNALIDSALEQTIGQLPPHEITPPIVFRYLSASELDSLYGQIEPSLIEEERKVSTASGRKLGGKVKVGVDDVASAEGEAASDSKLESSSSFKILVKNPERRALELVNYCLSSHRLAYYSTSDAWYVDVSFHETRQRFSAYSRHPSDLGSDHEPQKELSEDQTSNDTADEADKKRKRWSQALDEELEGLSGIVLIEGSYEVSRTSRGLELKHLFSPVPHVIQFKAEIPPQPDSSSWKSGVRLRMLGVVLRPLGRDGNVMIHPIAIF